MSGQPSHLHLLQGMYFEWDRSKAVANEQKHGVTFEEAATVLEMRMLEFMAIPTILTMKLDFCLLGPQFVSEY